MKQAVLTISLIVMIIVSCIAQSVLPMKKVSLFKNSTCLISKEGQLKVKDGKLVLPVPSSALYGTFWIGAAKENSLKSIVVKTTYHKVLLKGTIVVENLQPKQVIIDIAKHVNGTVTNDGDGKMKKQKTYNSVNPYSDLTWQVTLNASEKKTLTCEYEVLFAPYPY